MNRKKILDIIGKVFTVLCLGFIVYKFLSFDVDFSILLDFKILIFVIVCMIMLAIPPYLNSLSYQRILNFLGVKETNIKEIVDIYVSSNIGKYLPGNVMHFAGRNVLGSKYNLSNKSLLAASLLEVGLKILVGVLIAVTFSYQYFMLIIKENFNDYLLYIIAIVAVIVIGAVLFFALRYRKQIKIQNTFKNISYVIVMDLIIFILNIICFLLIYYAISGNVSVIMQNALSISGIYILAWLVGYLTPGAPGGIGVKEAVMIFLLAGIMTESDILLVGVIARLSNILGDTLAFGVNKIFNRAKADENNNT